MFYAGHGEYEIMHMILVGMMGMMRNGDFGDDDDEDEDVTGGDDDDYV